MNTPILLNARDLSREYIVRSGLFRKKATLQALSGVSFELDSGKTLAVVGESGCGKSTLARLIAMIEPANSGQFFIEGQNVEPSKWGELRTNVQIVFQNPYSSLNPRQKIGRILEEPLVNFDQGSALERRQKALKMLELVGLRPEHYERYPHMFSGGQRQRIAIARALMLRPKILVLDEPVSALDLSIQSQVLNLLGRLQGEMDLAYLFISHDLSVVKHIADEVMVMYLGRVMEYGRKQDLFENPRHPYTRALFSATPVADPTTRKERIRLEGELPSPLDAPRGCVFSGRCRKADEQCFNKRPELSGSKHLTACHYPE